MHKNYTTKKNRIKGIFVDTHGHCYQGGWKFELEGIKLDKEAAFFGYGECIEVNGNKKCQGFKERNMKSLSLRNSYLIK
jgi:hypothetical protein